LLQFDFNDAVTWPVTSQKPGQAGVIAGKFGTVDTANSKDASGGLLLIMDRGASTGWVSRVQSGALAVQNTETNLGKLTLSFSLSASRALPSKFWSSRSMRSRSAPADWKPGSIRRRRIFISVTRSICPR
jgi:hypothetical protein